MRFVVFCKNLIMNDITIIFLTASRVPKEWVKFHRSVLEKAIGQTPVISLSRAALDFGTNIVQTEAESSSNVFFQLLRGAKLAKTSYIAVAEDDTLYPADHFKLRPPDGAVAYNLSRWVVNIARNNPCYYSHANSVNASLIGPRELVIRTLEERYNKYPNGTPVQYTGEIGRHEIENGLQIRRVKKVSLYTDIPIIQFKHNYRRPEVGNVAETQLGPIQSYDIPYWGKVEELVKHFV